MPSDSDPFADALANAVAFPDRVAIGDVIISVTLPNGHAHICAHGNPCPDTCSDSHPHECELCYPSPAAERLHRS